MNYMLESQIEKTVTKYAIDNSFLSMKMYNLSDPDRLYITPKGNAFFMEFKRFGKKPTRIQQYTINKIQNNKIPVFVVDNIDRGKDIINQYIRG